MTNRVRKAVFPGRRPRHPPASGHQDHSQGDGHDRRPAADPICGRRGARGGDRAADLRHRARQVGAGRLFRPWRSSSRRRCASKGKSLDVLEPSQSSSARSLPFASSSRSGLGHAVWCARDMIGDEPFAVLLPDDLMAGTPGALKQMVDAWEKVGGNLLATEEVPAEKTSPTGSSTLARRDGALTEVRGLVEKPDPAEAPSQPRRDRPLHPPARGDAGARRPGDAARAARSSSPTRWPS